ncbi:hypothetical protein BJ546DRAFT_845195 [Cryomyces antarcticus]
MHRSDPSTPTVTSPGAIVGPPLVQQPAIAGRLSSSTNTTIGTASTIPYRESGQRWMERQEVHSLRLALEDMDLQEEQKVYAAAQDEASEIVWKHLHPHAVRSPDTPYDYREHLRKEAHGPEAEKEDHRPTEKSHASPKKSYAVLADAVASDIAIHRRRTSSGSKRRPSGEKGPFTNPNDQIYEEPEEERSLSEVTEEKTTSSAVPAQTRRNPFARVRLAHERLERSNSAPVLETKKRFDRFEIQRNLTSRSRDAGYISNTPPLPLIPTKSFLNEDTSGDVNGDPVKTRDGVEIRGGDIRAATSMRLKDRSPKLPTPKMVSDSPRRPIVSFQSGWKPREVELKQEQSEPQFTPSIEVQVVPSIPSICLPHDESSSTIIEPPTPDINAPSRRLTRPLPTPTVDASRPNPPRPRPHHFVTAPATSNAVSIPHWSPSLRRTVALCTHCALPISGRTVSAASARFHPGCFTCYHCGEGLECVAFYPEPDATRAERLERIHRRQQGEEVSLEGPSESEDGDESPRFYCHLDFHEFFSPRCKSCKTPIEGEVVVACGAEWHVGHFFCAQCGDPFDAHTPFVEKEGYACTKCRKCRKPVTDVVVKALGGEWHGECFCCAECDGPFEDGRYFLRAGSEVPVCVKCEERRLKA